MSAFRAGFVLNQDLRGCVNSADMCSIDEYMDIAIVRFLLYYICCGLRRRRLASTRMATLSCSAKLDSGIPGQLFNYQ